MEGEEEPAPIRDPFLEKLHDTPKFKAKGKFYFPEETRKRPMSAFKKDSTDSFGRRSKSNIELIPINSTKISKIEINYNSYGNGSMVRQSRLSPHSLTPQTTSQRLFSATRSKSKIQLV